MRLPLILALITCTAATSVAFAADKETQRDNPTATSAATTQDWCCNTTCPVDGKPLDKDVKTIAFHPVTGPKAPDQLVGFCSDDCRAAYAKNPAKYDQEISAQIQHRREAANPKSN